MWLHGSLHSRSIFYTAVSPPFLLLQFCNHPERLPVVNITRSKESWAISWRMRWSTPCRTHCCNRLRHVWYGGYLRGRSFQGPPVRKIHRIPFNTSRGSRGGRPLESLGGVRDLIIGSIRFHCSLVISIIKTAVIIDCLFLQKNEKHINIIALHDVLAAFHDTS